MLRSFLDYLSPASRRLPTMFCSKNSLKDHLSKWVDIWMIDFDIEVHGSFYIFQPAVIETYAFYEPCKCEYHTNKC